MIVSYIQRRQMRTFFVKIDNIKVSESMKRTRVIEATTTEELMEKICDYYGFDTKFRNYLQLWSGTMGQPGRQRLDTTDTIPQEYENIWVRGVVPRDSSSN